MRALAGSVAVHAALVAGLVMWVGQDRGPAEPPGRPTAATSTIEIIMVDPPRPRAAGASSAAGVAAVAGPSAAATPRRARPAVRPRPASVAELVDVRVEPAGEAAGGDRGRDAHGGGGGGGDGSAIGGGGTRGGGLLSVGVAVTELPAPPPPPRASRARPAKLIYPAREREVEDGELFVARVTVDDDGYVVGARLVRGTGGHRDSEAASLIFKFRYLPALDDDGRAITSTFEQRFAVAR